MASEARIGPTDMDGEFDASDTEGHRMAANVNETIVSDEADEPGASDTEGHRLVANVNDTIVSDEADDEPAD